MIFAGDMTTEQKLTILTDAAKYDVACTSSGVDRAGKNGSIGNTAAGGICHTFTADGRCVSLLKILFTNECIFDCKYCANRSSNDVPRATFTPEEVCTLTMEFYRRNYIEGLFLSSGIVKTPDYTMELICRSLMLLREKYRFNGYIHCKAIPGATDDLIELCGWYADRMSVNLELPTAEGLKALAPHKSRKNILRPMRQIQGGIEESRQLLGMKGGNKGAYWHTTRRVEGQSIEAKREEDAIWLSESNAKGRKGLKVLEADMEDDFETLTKSSVLGDSSDHMSISAFTKQSTQQRNLDSEVMSNGTKVPGLMNIGTNKNSVLTRVGSNRITERGFVPAGQSTQMIIGATPESDYQIISVAEALYQKFDLKRVFYSAFIRVNEDNSLPVLAGGPPLLREHRLYQADWLLRYYGFEAQELLTERKPNFNVFLDPKCDWAVAHLDQFPIEVNKADYFTLLRVPGIGLKSADRIVKARKLAMLTFDDLKKIGVVLKRALYFITCGGKMMFPTKLEEDYIVKQLAETDERLSKGLMFDGSMTYQQMTLFDDVNFGKTSYN